MPEKTIAQKMFVKEGMRLLFVNTPKGYQADFHLPKGGKVVKASAAPVEFIQVFVANEKELKAQLPKLKKLLAPNGRLWVSYLKGTAKTKTDINRDTVHAYGKTVGLDGVSLISLDDDWSAMRFKKI